MKRIGRQVQTPAGRGRGQLCLFWSSAAVCGGDTGCSPSFLRVLHLKAFGCLTNPSKYSPLQQQHVHAHTCTHTHKHTHSTLCTFFCSQGSRFPTCLTFHVKMLMLMAHEHAIQKKQTKTKQAKVLKGRDALGMKTFKVCFI